LLSATVEPIRKLIAVAAQVLYRDFVERAVDAELEQRESISNRVGVNNAHRVDARVVNNVAAQSICAC